jgi:hypothetical protein
MRRLALALLSAGALTACSGGGSVLNFDSSTTPDRVIVTVVGPSNIARVIPGASLPLSATAIKGTGYLSNNRFKWSAALTTGSSYVFNTLGQTKPCADVTLTQSGTTSVYLPDMSIYIAIDPTNESNILFIPPPTIPLPFSAPPGSTIAINFPYCVAVSATALDSDGHPTTATGSITVAVVNPQAPVQ